MSLNKSGFFFPFFFLLCCGSVSGNYVFYAVNKDLQKSYAFAPGADIGILFDGYLGQPASCKGRIASITDSSLTLLREGIIKKDSLSILIKDMRGFRPYGTGRKLAKAGMEIVLFSGTVVLYTAVLAHAPVTALARLSISLAAGLLARQTVKWTFPDNIRYTTDEGWYFYAGREKSLFRE
jgi:hypothetical protein